MYERIKSNSVLTAGISRYSALAAFITDRRRGSESTCNPEKEG